MFDEAARRGGAVKKGLLAKDMQTMKQALPYNVSTCIQKPVLSMVVPSGKVRLPRTGRQ